MIKPVAHAYFRLLGMLAALDRFAFLGLGARLLGRLFSVAGFRSRVIRENIKRAFPDYSEHEIENLIARNYRHYGQLFYEFLHSFAVSSFRRFLEREVDVEGEEYLRAALAKGKGIFVMTAHIGNWELLPAHGSHVLDVPITMVTKKLKPEWLHEVVEDTRKEIGTGMAFEPQTMKLVMKALRRKEVVGFAIDQFAGAPVGARVPFFGTPVGSHTALATLALRTDAPVVPGLAVRKPNGRYLVRFEPALETVRITEKSPGYASAQEEEVIRNTAAYTKWVEERVREFPDQWLWIHRRWKGDLSPLSSKVLGEMLK